MISTGIQERNEKLEEYLQLLQSMSFELERAIAAISGNSIHGLEDSLANQEAFSTRLMELADDLSRPVQSVVAQGQVWSNDEIQHNICAASSRLQSLNRRYSALLKFSSRSVALMVSLFSSYQGQLQEETGPRLKVETWSCQV